MKKYGILAIISLGMLSWGAIGETYKCVSPDKKISYSGQMSMMPGVKCEQMFVKKPAVTQAEPAPAETTKEMSAPPSNEATKSVEKSEADKALEAKRKKTETDEAKIKADKAAEDKLAEQKIRDENCLNAKSALQTYTHGGRIRKVNEKGEFEYLDDAAISQKADQAKKDVETWCGT